MAVESIVTSSFRLAFPQVFEPKAGIQGGKEKFGITMLYPKNGTALIPGLPGEGILEIRKLIFAACKESWGADKTKWPNLFKTVDFANYVSPTGKDGWPIRDGNSKEWEGFSECLFVRAVSMYAPGVVDNKLQAIIDKTKVFGGLICRAQVNAFSYNNAGNIGVSIGLNNLQILKDDGTSYGNQQNPADVFDAFGDSGTTASGPIEGDPFA